MGEILTDSATLYEIAFIEEGWYSVYTDFIDCSVANIENQSNQTI